VFRGAAATMGGGISTDECMKNYDLLVATKLRDASKVDLKKTYSTEFVKVRMSCREMTAPMLAASRRRRPPRSAVRLGVPQRRTRFMPCPCH
jgi:hypothetical protein